MTRDLVAIVCFSGFSPFHLSVPCMIFGDTFYDQPMFDLKLCSWEPAPLRTDQGLSIETISGLEVLVEADIVIVPSWRDPREKPDDVLLDALRAAHGRGSQIVGLCLGAYPLAYAGLLDGREAATHWEFEVDFKQRFPQVSVNTNALYVDDGLLVTSAGTAAGLDCCLHILRRRHGSKIANKIARRMVVAPHRSGGQAQFIEQPVPATTRDLRINELLEFISRNLAKQHHLDDLADRVAMSRRTFTRRFHKATSMSVGAWIISARLRQACNLLEATSHSVEAVAAIVGFDSVSSFRQHFKAAFEVSPAEWRRTFQSRRHAAPVSAHGAENPGRLDAVISP